MRDHYDAIYLSPHLDDVAYSCGGQIHQRINRSESVLAVTVCAGDPRVTEVSKYADSLHREWALARDVAAARRLEDENAWSRMGVDLAHWDTPDCIYRVDPTDGSALYGSPNAIFGSLHPSELALIERIAQQMQRLPANDLVLLPLALGGHVDHVLTRAAGERVFGADCAYYEDYPYSEDRTLLESILADTESGWDCEIIPLDATDVSARTATMAAYESQLGLFYGRPAMERQVAKHVEAIGGEPIWRRSSN